jgi:hypothetical protein
VEKSDNPYFCTPVSLRQVHIQRIRLQEVWTQLDEYSIFPPPTEKYQKTANLGRNISYYELLDNILKVETQDSDISCLQWMCSAIQDLFDANRSSVWRERTHSVQEVEDFGFVIFLVVQKGKGKNQRKKKKIVRKKENNND